MRKNDRGWVYVLEKHDVFSGVVTQTYPETIFAYHAAGRRCEIILSYESQFLPTRKAALEHGVELMEARIVLSKSYLNNLLVQLKGL